MVEDQLAFMGYCLYCKELYRTDLSSAKEAEDFCCGMHEEAWHLEIEDDFE